MRLTALILLLFTALACGGSPSGPSTPGPGGDPEVAIVWDGHTAQWGAADSLRATVTGAPAGAEVVWRSLDDFYLAQPVVLGRGPAITTAALKPGTTTVEAALVVVGSPVASATRSVSVVYRESWNMALDSHVPYDDGTVGDVWVAGDHALLARRSAGGISIVSLTGTAREVGRFTALGLFTQDVQAEGTVAFFTHEYVSAEAAAYSSTVTILDIADPASPRVVGTIPRTETPTAHTVWVDGTTLYVAAPSGTRRFHSYDVSDPSAPRPLATLASTNGSAHDMHARNGVAFGSYLALRPGEIGELVIATADDLAPLSFTTYPGAFTHSSWLSRDGRYLYVTDEIVNAPIRIYDVSNPATPVLVGSYQPRVGTVPHHFIVRDDRFAYLSHYKHGVEVLDVSDPLRPRLVGFYDTFPGAQADVVSPAGALALAHDDSQTLYDGVWGVHWTADGRVVASDMHSGLYVLRFTP
ncbi:MAG: hypothetical protein H0W36_04265 [Gemmatimonadetes bacterium]|nr:hypothetical protein [Gemmatimonadota bacterium]